VVGVLYFPFVSKRMSISLDKHHPVLKDMLEVIKTQTNTEPSTYHLAVCTYFLSQVPAAMRVKIETPVGDSIPVNVYVMALAESGFGKGHTINLIEQGLLKPFRKKYEEEFLPVKTDISISNKAIKRSSKLGTSEEEEYGKLTKELNALGPYTFTFDSGTSPALKQLRQRLLLTGSGSLNLQMDEMGSHLEGNNDLLQVFLELYDQGNTNVKLIKESSTQSRYSKIEGTTPANMLLFGTPAKVFDGAEVEKAFMTLLEIGYARRSLFGFSGKQNSIPEKQSAEVLYDSMRTSQVQERVKTWAEHLEQLADIEQHDKIISLPRDEAIALLQYKIDCEEKAERLNEFRSIEKAELNHRYFKALKIAGVFSFIDGESSLSRVNLDRAIYLVETCADTFEKLINQEPNYVRLARYLLNVEKEQYQNELQESLPFFKGSIQHKQELIELATAWGYRNGVLIKRGKTGDIDYYSATGMKNTSLDSLIVSYSQHQAYGYVNETLNFDQLVQLVQTPDYHWLNHQVQEGHRKESNIICAFNLLVLDVDGGCTDTEVKQYLKDYLFILNYTKSHTDDSHRFRIILPLAQQHCMSSEEYKSFSGEIFKWLPFEVDTTSNQRSKKWLCSDKGVWVNQGVMLDSLQFIPETKKGVEYAKQQKKIANLPRLERWVINQAVKGNRNNNLYRYGMILKDNHIEPGEIMEKLQHVNKELESPLAREELNNIHTQVIKHEQ